MPPKAEKKSYILSVKLSKTLRHNALKMGLHMRADGNVALQDLLCHKEFSGYTTEDILKVVKENNKKRFELSDVDGTTMIRACQGHTIPIVSDEELLTEILDSSTVPICVHGTYKEVLPEIMATGLNRMKRNHIHMALGLFGEEGVVSGMRKNCTAFIYINIAMAMAQGIRFYQSHNAVILSKGLNDSGVIPVEFFEKIVEK